jgi:protein-disulfide isomerase
MKDIKKVEQKAPALIKSTLNPIKSDSLVVDFESMLVPGAILLAGLMISLSIIFSFRGTNLSTYTATKTGDTTTGTDTTGTDTQTDDSNDGPIAEVSLDDDPIKGDIKKAKIAIIEFSDFECPFCKRHFTDVYPKLIENYVKTGKAVYVFRDLPLTFHEPAATIAANSAQCVFDQLGSDKYYTFHDALFDKTQSNGYLTSPMVIELGKKISGLNQSKFTTCVNNQTFKAEVQKDSADAAKIKINGTPGFVIGKLEADGKTVKNGTFLGGAYPYENFESIINGLL